MSKFKISADYWESLNEPERLFIQSNVHSHGVQYCKRIITLARNFPKWDDIVNFSHYIKDKTASLYVNVWIVFNDGKIIGTIHKTDNIGVSERIEIKTPNGYIPVWHNLQSANPKKGLVLSYINDQSERV